MATRNDITGDALISRVNSESFRDNFDKIFRSKKKETDHEQTTDTGILQPTPAPSDDENN